MAYMKDATGRRLDSITVPSDFEVGKVQRNVGARPQLNDVRSDGVITSQTSRTRHVIRGGAVMVRLVFANWYLPSGSAEQPMGNNYDLKASIENPASSTGSASGTSLIPVFFGGKRTATVENNGLVVSDPVLINAPADWAIFVRSYATVASGRFPTPYAVSTSNSVQPDTSGVSEGAVNNTDSVDSGTISAGIGGASGFAFGPVAVLTDALNSTHTHGALVIGDSIARGTGIVNARGSFLVQACIDKTIPVYRVAVGGDSFTYSKQPINVYRRMGLARYARHAVVNMGTNDVFSGSSLATLQADAIAFWGLLANQGLKVHQSTILPRPGASTDGYLTVAGQSITNSSYETVRTGFNTWLRSGQAVIDAAGALTSVIDAAALIEVNSSNVLTLNGGYWKALGTVVHTNTATSITTGSSTGTITVTGAGWTTNQFQNKVVLITGGTTGVGQFARITSNTATQISFNFGNPPWTTNPTGTVTFQVQDAYCYDNVHPTEPAYQLISDALDLSYLKTT